MRLTEYFVTPGTKVYVLGVAKHSGKGMRDTPEYSKKEEKKKKKLIKTLQELKRSPLLMERYDLNKDGKIDAQEWERAREDVSRWTEHKIDKEDIAKTEAIKVEIGKGDEGQTFFISDQSQKELCSKMNWKCSGGIFGGAALVIICTIVLLYRSLH